MNGLVKNIGKYKPPLTETDTRLQNSNVHFNEYALKGIVEDTPLSQIFFSKTNMDLLQKTIRWQVYQESKKLFNAPQIIDYQSYNALFIIMRSIYLQFGDSGIPSSKIPDKIKSLNKLVTEYSIQEQILPNLKQYSGYLDKMGDLQVPLEHPKNESLKGTKTFDISNLM